MLWERFRLVLDAHRRECLPERLLRVRKLGRRHVLERTDAALRRLLWRLQQRRGLPLCQRRTELLPAPGTHERLVQQLRREPHQVPAVVLLVGGPTVAVSTYSAIVPRADKLLRLAVDPYSIAAVAAVGLLALTALGDWRLVPWAAFVGAIAGWSSAWSP